MIQILTITSFLLIIWTICFHLKTKGLHSHFQEVVKSVEWDKMVDKPMISEVIQWLTSKQDSTLLRNSERFKMNEILSHNFYIKFINCQKKLLNLIKFLHIIK